ncbi:MAG: hypothetical protein LH616_02265, partial [Ilumatobacteraceae bacterium]|nr:hypothetical protein [Ilumatobacteraceae bacterium]
DPEQAIEAGRVQLGGDDTFTRPTNRAPRHPTQPGDPDIAMPPPRRQISPVVACRGLEAAGG